MTNTKYIIPVKDDNIACIQLDVSDYSFKEIDKKTYKSSGSPFGLLTVSVGTVVFMNNNLQLYGVIQRSEINNLRLVFVSYDVLKDARPNRYLNIKGTKVNIDNIKFDDLENHFLSTQIIKEVKFSNSVKLDELMTTQEFKESLLKEKEEAVASNIEDTYNNKVKEAVEEKEEAVEGTIEETVECTIEDTYNNSTETKTEVTETKEEISEQEPNKSITSELIANICRNTIAEFLEQSKSVNKRDEILLLKEKELREKEKEIQTKLNELNESIEKNKELKETLVEAIAIARDNTVNKISEQLIGVSDIIELDESTLNNNDTADTILYESMIKAVKTGDVISIPKKVYSRLSTLLKKNLYMNLEYTVYKAIVEIRFETKSINFMLAVVDYDEEQEFVKLTVMKPFNEEFVTPSQMIDYELKYNEWHKRNSFINS